MARIPLLGGAYKQASLIAGAQRSINLYPEFNSERAQSPVNVTHYSRPGLTPLGAPDIPGQGRACYVTTLGELYVVVDQRVYYVDPDWVFHLVGQLFTVNTNPVSFTDNGQVAFLVDNDASGSQIVLATRAFSQITDPNFLGATRGDFLDSFCIFNEPNTPNWYCTLSNSPSFNALFFGTKTAWPDNIQTLIASERQAWIMGKYKSEIWTNAGLVPFPFQLVSGSIIEHGVAGQYAIGRQDVNIYFLSQSPEGARLAMRGAFLGAQRISTNAIEEEWLTYPKVDDCIVTTYQIRGHPFVHYDFPTADRTWVFDESTQEWHEEGWFDTNGVQHRTKDLFKAFAYGVNVSLDWATGRLYKKDETNYTDNELPITYRRGMPHLVDNMHFSRITLWKVIADIECGAGTGTITGSPWSAGFSPGFGPLSGVTGTEIFLRLSRDRGFTFTSHSMQKMGLPGGYNTRPTFWRCGQAYDIVPELQWTGPMHTALQGVFAEVEESGADE